MKLLNTRVGILLFNRKIIQSYIRPISLPLTIRERHYKTSNNQAVWITLPQTQKHSRTHPHSSEFPAQKKKKKEIRKTWRVFCT